MAEELEAVHERLPLDQTATAFLEALPAAKRKTLCRQILDAAEAEHQRLNRALEDASAFVPAPLRRRARKLLLG